MSYTSNFDLIKMAQKYGIILNGVFMKDELPSRVDKGGYIINMQDSTEGDGTHWVCVYLEKEPVYFDSFGVDPPISIVKWMCKISSNMLIGNKQVQNINSGYCGQYCLYFLKYMQDNKQIELKKRFKNFLNSWNDDPEENLTHLKEIIKRMT